MEVLSITRTHNLESCEVEGYKAIYTQWELKVEGADYYSVLDLCQKFHNKKYCTREQFLENLDYALQKSRSNYRAALTQHDFYELEKTDDIDLTRPWIQTWIYTLKYIPQNYV